MNNPYYNKYKKYKEQYINLKYRNNYTLNGGGILKDKLTEMGFSEAKAGRYERELDPHCMATNDNVNRLVEEAMDKQGSEPFREIGETRFYIYTTGLGEAHGISDFLDRYLTLQANILKVLRENDYTNIIVFRHYDRDLYDHIEWRIRSSTEDSNHQHEFNRRHFAETNIDEIIEIGKNHLVIDMAHIFQYGNNRLDAVPSKSLVNFEPYDTSATGVSVTDKYREIEGLNVFYPGYLPDYSSDQFITDFRYIDIDTDKNIITFIDKIVEHSLSIRLRNIRGDNDSVIVAPGVSITGSRASPKVIFSIPTFSNIYCADMCNMLVWRY